MAEALPAVESEIIEIKSFRPYREQTRECIVRRWRPIRQNHSHFFTRLRSAAERQQESNLRLKRYKIRHAVLRRRQEDIKPSSHRIDCLEERIGAIRKRTQDTSPIRHDLQELRVCVATTQGLSQDDALLSGTDRSHIADKGFAGKGL